MNLRSTLRDLALSYANEIVAAARSASMGELFEPDTGSQTLADRLSQRAATWATRYKLSDAEVDLLCSAALGKTPAEIARKQGKSTHAFEALKARLLRRTHDASLERAANRLLRDLVERAPVVVAVAGRPSVAVRAAAGGGAKLQARIEQLRRLAGQPASDATRYAMGAIVKELKKHPESYGESAVSTAAAAVGEDQAGLYRFASVAERWSDREVRALLSAEGISWSHLVELARVESPAARASLLRRARRERMPLRKLHDLVRRATK